MGLINWELREFVSVDRSWVPLRHDLLLSKLTLVCLIILFLGPYVIVGFLKTIIVWKIFILYLELLRISCDYGLSLCSEEMAEVLTELITELRCESEGRALACGD